MILLNKLHKFQSYLFMGFTVLLISMRFMYLDQDTGPRIIVGQTAEDESFYTNSSIALLNDINHRETEESRENRLLPFSFYSFPLTFTSLYIGGYNFWALRIPVVLISLLGAWLLYLILRKIIQNITVIYLSMIFYLSEFFLFNMSRIQNPQAYSIFIILMIVYIILNYKNTFQSAMILGITVTFAVTFFYIYNAFLSISVGLWLIYYCQQSRSLKPFFYTVIGGLTGLIIFVSVLFLTNSQFDYINCMISHGGGVENKFGILSIYKAYIQIITTNFFRFNLSFLILFIFSFFYFILNRRDLLKVNNQLNLFLIFCFLSVFLENIFVVNFSFKKLIYLFPLALILSAQFIENMPKNKLNFATFFVLFVSIFSAYKCYSLNISDVYWNNVNHLQNIPNYLNEINIMIALIVLVIILTNFKGIKYVFILMSLFSMALVIKYNFYERKYNLRNALIEIGNTYKNYIIIEDFGLTHQFYSNNTPGLYLFYSTVMSNKEYSDIYKKIYQNHQNIIWIKLDLNDHSMQSEVPFNNIINKNGYSYIAKKVYKMEYYSIQVFEKVSNL